jgi:TPR repeat protein
MRGDHHGAVAYFDIACGLGHGPSCTLLVEIYSRGRGARVDQIRAAHFMRQACKAAGVDCADATHAPSTPRAIELSAQAHRRACAAGQSAACANLALMVDLGMGVERDMLDAALLYGRACEGGSAASCGAYGMLFRDLTEDVEEASTHRPALGDLARGW